MNLSWADEITLEIASRDQGEFSDRVRSILLASKYFDDLDIASYVRVSRILFLIWGD